MKYISQIFINEVWQFKQKTCNYKINNPELRTIFEKELDRHYNNHPYIKLSNKVTSRTSLEYIDEKFGTESTTNFYWNLVPIIMNYINKKLKENGCSTFRTNSIPGSEKKDHTDICYKKWKVLGDWYNNEIECPLRRTGIIK